MDEQVLLQVLSTASTEGIDAFTSAMQKNAAAYGEYTQKMQEGTGATAQAATAQQGMAAAASGWSKGMIVAGGAAAAAAAGLLGVALTGMRDLSALSRQYQAQTGATKEEAAAAIEVARSLYHTHEQGYKEILDTMTTLRQELGMTEAQAGSLAGKFLDFSTATGMNAEQATTLLTTTLKAFNLPAAETGAIMDKIVGSSQQTGMSVSQLTSTLNMIAPSLSRANMSMDEGIGLLDMFKAAGVSASVAPRALMTALNKVKSPEQLKNLIHDIMSTEDASIRGQKAVALFGNMAGSKLANAMKPGAKGIDDYVKGLGAMEGATEKTADVVSGSLGKKIALVMKGASDNVVAFGQKYGQTVVTISTIGTAVAGVAQQVGIDLPGAMTSGASKILLTAKYLATELARPLVSGASTIISSVVSILSGLGGTAVTGVARAAGAVGSLAYRAGFAAVNLISDLVLSGWNAVASSISVRGAALAAGEATQTAFTLGLNLASALGSAIRTGFGALAGAGQAAAESIASGMITSVETGAVGTIIGNLISTSVDDVVGPAGATAGGTMLRSLSQIVSKGTADMASVAGKSLGTAVGEAAGSAAGVTMTGALGSSMGGVGRGVGTAVGESAGAAAGPSFKTALSSAMRGITGAVGSIFAPIARAAQGALSSIFSGAVGAVGAAESLFAPLTGAIGKVAGPVSGAIGSLVKKVYSLTSTIALSMADTVTDIVASGWRRVINNGAVAGAVVDAFLWTSSLTKRVGAFVTGIPAMVATAWHAVINNGRVAGAITDVLLWSEGYLRKAGSLAGAVRDMLTGAFAGAQGYLRTSVGGLSGAMSDALASSFAGPNTRGATAAGQALMKQVADGVRNTGASVKAAVVGVVSGAVAATIGQIQTIAVGFDALWTALSRDAKVAGAAIATSFSSALRFGREIIDPILGGVTSAWRSIINAPQVRGAVVAGALWAGHLYGKAAEAGSAIADALSGAWTSIRGRVAGAVAAAGASAGVIYVTALNVGQELWMNLQGAWSSVVGRVEGLVASIGARLGIRMAAEAGAAVAASKAIEVGVSAVAGGAEGAAQGAGIVVGASLAKGIEKGVVASGGTKIVAAGVETGLAAVEGVASGAGLAGGVALAKGMASKAGDAGKVIELSIRGAEGGAAGAAEKVGSSILSRIVGALGGTIGGVAVAPILIGAAIVQAFKAAVTFAIPQLKMESGPAGQIVKDMFKSPEDGWSTDTRNVRPAIPATDTLRNATADQIAGYTETIKAERAYLDTLGLPVLGNFDESLNNRKKALDDLLAYSQTQLDRWRSAIPEHIKAGLLSTGDLGAAQVDQIANIMSGWGAKESIEDKAKSLGGLVDENVAMAIASGKDLVMDAMGNVVTDVSDADVRAKQAAILSGLGLSTDSIDAANKQADIITKIGSDVITTWDENWNDAEKSAFLTHAGLTADQAKQYLADANNKAKADLVAADAEKKKAEDQKKADADALAQRRATAEQMAQIAQKERDAFKTNRSTSTGLWDSAIAATKAAQTPMKRAAQVVAELQSKALADGLKSGDPEVRNVWQDTQKALNSELIAMMPTLNIVGKDQAYAYGQGWLSAEDIVAKALKNDIAVANAATDLASRQAGISSAVEFKMGLLDQPGQFKEMAKRMAEQMKQGWKDSSWRTFFAGQMGDKATTTALFSGVTAAAATASSKVSQAVQGFIGVGGKLYNLSASQMKNYLMTFGINVTAIGKKGGAALRDTLTPYLEAMDMTPAQAKKMIAAIAKSLGIKLPPLSAPKVDKPKPPAKPAPLDPSKFFDWLPGLMPKPPAAPEPFHGHTPEPLPVTAPDAATTAIGLASQAWAEYQKSQNKVTADTPSATSAIVAPPDAATAAINLASQAWAEYQIARNKALDTGAPPPVPTLSPQHGGVTTPKPAGGSTLSPQHTSPTSTPAPAPSGPSGASVVAAYDSSVTAAAAASTAPATLAGLAGRAAAALTVDPAIPSKAASDVVLSYIGSLQNPIWGIAALVSTASVANSARSGLGAPAGTGPGSSWYTDGYNSLQAWINGMSAAMGGFASAFSAAVAVTVTPLIKAKSPPGPKSPLHDIDKWGLRTGQAWSQSLADGIDGSAAEEQVRRVGVRLIGSMARSKRTATDALPGTLGTSSGTDRDAATLAVLGQIAAKMSVQNQLTSRLVARDPKVSSTSLAGRSELARAVVMRGR